MLEPSHNNELPAIPGKRYFTIGEVSELCAVKPHVLRYWEQEFPQLKPVKRRGNRRYYQREDVLTIRQIRSLLYEQGYTIGGARQRMTDEGGEDALAGENQVSDQGNHPGTGRAAEGPATRQIAFVSLAVLSIMPPSPNRRNPHRGVAQPGSALDWGSSGRRFKSCRPDQLQKKLPDRRLFFCPVHYCRGVIYLAISSRRWALSLSSSRAMVCRWTSSGPSA